LVPHINNTLWEKYCFGPVRAISLIKFEGTAACPLKKSTNLSTVRPKTIQSCNTTLSHCANALIPERTNSKA